MAMSWLPFTERRRGLIGLVGRTIDSNAEDGMAGRIGGVWVAMKDRIEQ